MNSSELAAVQSMLDGAAEIARNHFGRAKPQWKPTQSYVTQADYAVQDCVTAWLNANYPDDGIIAEEHALRREPARGSRSWIIDPIDGTASFVRGFSTWGIGLALVEDYEPVAGFFACPATNERYWAVQGQGTWRNGHTVQVRMQTALHGESLLLAFSRIHRTTLLNPEFPGKVRSLGSTIAHTAYAAAGGSDAALLARSMIWDLAPGMILLREAGGVMRYLHGEEVKLKDIWGGGPTEQPAICGHPDTLDAFDRQVFSCR